MTPERFAATRRLMNLRTHKHGSGQMAVYCFLGSDCVVVVVGNYKFATFINEIGHHLGMLLLLLNPRRIQIAPFKLVNFASSGVALRSSSVIYSM